MKFTEEQLEQLQNALSIIDNVHSDVSSTQGEDSEEFESVNAIWCALDNVTKGKSVL